MHLELNWSLDVAKGTYPDKIPFSKRILYHLADRGIFKKDDLPWIRLKNVENKLFGGLSVSVRKSIRNLKESLDILKGTRLLVNITKVLLSHW